MVGWCYLCVYYIFVVYFVCGYVLCCKFFVDVFRGVDIRSYYVYGFFVLILLMFFRLYYFILYNDYVLLYVDKIVRVWVFV